MSLPKERKKLKGNSDLISIIVPIYNVEKYLRRCVDSILIQSYTNIEIILIDDGSNDGSSQICDEFAEKDKRVKVVHKKNEGVSAARNCGLDNCNGKYLAFVDSDDYIEDDFIESLYFNLNEYNADVAICNYSIVKNGTKKSSTEHNNILVYDRIKAVNELLVAKSISSHLWNKLYKMDLWNNIRFPEGKTYEDLAVMYLIFDKVNSIVYSPIPKYNYLMRSGSIIHSMNQKQINDLKEAYTNRANFMENKYGKEIKKELDLSLAKTIKMIHAFSAESGLKDFYNSIECIEEYKVFKKITKGNMRCILSRQVGLRRKMEMIILYMNRNLYYKTVGLMRKRRS